jgi:hypothetical protein
MFRREPISGRFGRALIIRKGPVHANRQTVQNLPLTRRAGVFGIGEQLRVECRATEQPMPDRLAALLKQLEGGERYPESAAVRLAIINTGVRASSVPNGPRFYVPGPGDEPSDASSYHSRRARPPDLSAPSRRATALGRFEKLVLDLFDNHLSEPERETAVKTFSAYVQICHAMLDLGLITERELTAQSAGSEKVTARAESAPRAQ